MSGAPKVRSMNVADPEARPVLVPAGNKAGVVVPRKPASKPSRTVERAAEVAGAAEENKKVPPTAVVPSSSPPDLVHSLSFPSALRRQEQLLHSNLSLNASCSSDASSTSVRSRASTGRISRTYPVRKKKQTVTKAAKAVSDSISSPETPRGKKKCAWVTPNTEPCYATFHDEEWGAPVHDDKKLFELLVFSGALAELTWPAILSKRHIFREVFSDFEPAMVAKMNEKKIVAPGSTASSLLSEPKLRAIIENARQISKIVDEFGSFDKYCWSFVNHKPIVSSFRYPRQVPAKTPKADVISKDLVRRGFRCVGPTVVYSFMQAAGITNDHLISCYRFNECIAASEEYAEDKTQSKVEVEENRDCLELASAVDELNISQ